VIFSSKESKGSKAVEGETLLISKESKFEGDLFSQKAPSLFDSFGVTNLSSFDTSSIPSTPSIKTS